MGLIFKVFFAAFLLLFSLMLPAMAEEKNGTATFLRTSLVVKNMDASLSFWRDVMNYEVARGPLELPRAANEYLGWTADAVVRFASLHSSDGLGIGLLEVKQEGFAEVNIQNNPTGYGGVVLVHRAKNIDALYERARKANAVFKPLGLSRSGLSKQMFLKSPSGHVVEIYELLPKSEQ